MMGIGRVCRVADARQGTCYASVTEAGLCQNRLPIRLSKRDCCCGVNMGKGWGDDCDRCPAVGDGAPCRGGKSNLYQHNLPPGISSFVSFLCFRFQPHTAISAWTCMGRAGLVRRADLLALAASAPEASPAPAGSGAAGAAARPACQEGLAVLAASGASGDPPDPEGWARRRLARQAAL